MFPIYGGRFQLNVYDVPTMASPTNAQVAVSLFDYTCHHCRSMHPLLLEAQRQFSNSLVIVSLPMPLDPTCNPTLQRHYPPHTNACEYAKVGLAVWRANRARHHEFDQWLLAGEKPLPLPEAKQHAAQLVGAEAFDRAMRDPWVEEQLKINVAIYEVAYRAGQGSMPQLIVGQSVVVGSYLQTDLIKALTDNLSLPKPAP
jgi:protein-disulfide isomerase